jgi:hypothetical protein
MSMRFSDATVPGRITAPSGSSSKQRSQYASPAGRRPVNAAPGDAGLAVVHA